MRELRVSATTEPKKLAGAIVKTLKEDNRVQVKAMGAQAVAQSVKGLIVARVYLASEAKDLDITPAFDIREDSGGAEITVIVFHVGLRSL